MPFRSFCHEAAHIKLLVMEKFLVTLSGLRFVQTITIIFKYSECDM